jgi:hypothetical protein
MSAPAENNGAYEDLGRTLRREIDAARRRVDELASQRHELAARLQTLSAAEDAARLSLAALIAVAGDAGQLVPDLVDETVPSDNLRRLSGVELREMIARVALQRQAVGRPVHWSEWHTWLREAGFEAAGKKPEATFLTQLARSPVIRRTAQDGVYVLDLGQFAHQREQLNLLHHRLSDLPPPDQLALLGDARTQRRELQNEIARTERAIEEMWRVLANERPPAWPDNADLVPERVVAAWLQGS